MVLGTEFEWRSIQPNMRLASRTFRNSKGAGPKNIALAAAWMLALSCGSFAQAPQKKVTWSTVLEKSTFRVELGKAGWLKAFGDEHQIAVSDYKCTMQFDAGAPERSSVEIVIPARAMKVLDPPLSAADRAEVQKKMEGPEVLDIARFGEIRFVSKRVTTAGKNRYRLEGELRIRDTARPVSFELNFTPAEGGYRAQGEVPVRLTWFSIQPPSAGGGGIKVKDEIRVVFDLLLLPA